MAKESNLKKEFAPKDVQRMRNLLTGNAGEKTGIQSGYEKSRQDHIEGDVWEENSKTWTIKDGIKQTITKFDKLKKMFQIPLKCPSCDKPMSPTSLNKKMYSIHKECFECVIERETKLKTEGKYEEYEQNLMNSNKNYMLDELEMVLDNWINETDSFVSEDGVVESWSKSKGNEEFYKQAKENIKKSREEEI